MLELKKSYLWTCKQVHTRYSELILGILFFLEALIFVPVNSILILYCLEKREKAIRFALIATFATTLGGVTAYYIASILWNTWGFKIITSISSMEKFNLVCNQYEKYEYWAVLFAGFTPLPYKLITLSAGFCKIPIIPFIICSFVSRGTRFILTAVLIIIYGEKIKYFIDKYFKQLSLIIIASVFFFGLYVIYSNYLVSNVRHTSNYF